MQSMANSVKALTASPIFWGLIILVVLILLFRMQQREGLTAKKDVTITKNLPSNVKYVVKKANGEIKVVLTSGQIKRYAKGKAPSFMKKKTTPNPPTNNNNKKKKKDVTITKGLPSSVAYVVKKANGETVVVRNDGTQDRYAKGKLPPFLKKKPVSKNPTKSMKDVTITKNLPADVKYVVKKANGETKVVKKNGAIRRYPKGKAPSYVKPSKGSKGGSGGSGSKGGSSGSKGGSGSNGGSGSANQPDTVKEIGKAITNVQKKLDGINAALRVVQTNQKDKKILEQVRDMLDKRLSKLKEAEQKCYSGMYIDKGDVWLLE